MRKKALIALAVIAAAAVLSLRADAQRILDERPIITWNERTLEELLKALNDPNRDIRARAAWSLSMLKRDDLAPRLVVLLDDPSEDVRLAALSALAGTGVNGLDFDKVKSMFADSENPEIRRRSLRVIAASKRLDEADSLAIALKDKDVRVRIEGAMLLPEIQPARAVQLAGEALEDDDLRVRRYAMLSLAKIWDEHGDGDEHSPKALQAVEKLLEHDEPYIRAAACDAMGGVHARGIMPLMLGMFDDQHYLARRSAARSVGLIRIGREAKLESATQPLIGLLTDPDYTVREASAVSLRDFLPLPAIVHLADRLEDKEPEVRRAGAETLVEYLIQDALEAVAAKLLRSPMVEARREAAWVVAEWGDPYGADVAFEALKDVDVFVRALALKALRLAGDERAVPHALNALKWENREVRYFEEITESYKVASAFKDERFIPLIMQRLQLAPRWTALMQSDAGPPTSHQDVVGAIEASGYYATPEMIALLERTTGDPSMGEYAKMALAMARGVEYVPPKIDIQIDPFQKRAFFIHCFDE